MRRWVIGFVGLGFLACGGPTPAPAPAKGPAAKAAPSCERESKIASEMVARGELDRVVRWVAREGERCPALASVGAAAAAELASGAGTPVDALVLRARAKAVAGDAVGARKAWDVALAEARKLAKVDGKRAGPRSRPRPRTGPCGGGRCPISPRSIA